MIWNSAYWKEELFRHARQIRHRQTLKRWTERSSAGFEQDLMLGFYSVRKLIDAHMVSDEIRDRPLCLCAYPWTGTPVTYLNWEQIDKKYDLERPNQVTKPMI